MLTQGKRWNTQYSPLGQGNPRGPVASVKYPLDAYGRFCNRRKLLYCKHLGQENPGRRDVTPLIPTTYDDENGVLCNSFGSKVL